MPTEKNIEQKHESINLPLDTSELGELEETLANAGKVSEIVGESSGENGGRATGDDSKKKKTQSFFNFAGVGNQISKLLFSQNGKKKTVLPTVKIQQQRVRKVLQKETHKLIKKAERLQRSKNFSAAKLERIVFQIRNLQRLMVELLTAATDQIEKLYRKFFLKNS